MSDLNKAEFEDLNKIIETTLNTLIDCADRHNIDRDSFIKYFCTVFGTMTEVSTFKHYKAENFSKKGKMKS